MKPWLFICALIFLILDFLSGYIEWIFKSTEYIGLWESFIGLYRFNSWLSLLPIILCILFELLTSLFDSFSCFGRGILFIFETGFEGLEYDGIFSVLVTILFLYYWSLQKLLNFQTLMNKLRVSIAKKSMKSSIFIYHWTKITFSSIFKSNFIRFAR